MTYQKAVQLRVKAEAGNDPLAYLQAAEAFESLNMPTSAQRMRDRAAFYKKSEPLPVAAYHLLSTTK